MKFNLLNTALLGLILSACLSVNIANAGLITETWQGTVSDINNSSRHSLNDMHSLNDILSWTVTYDDKSVKRTIYNDGPDAIAGTLDDTIYEVRERVCPGVWCENFQVLADASFDLSNLFRPIYDELEPAGIDPFDINGINYSYRKIGETGIDNLGFYQDGNEANFWTDGEGSGSGRFAVYNALLEAHQFSLDDVTMISVSREYQVPEPSTFFIFALGIMGLAFRRAKK